MTDSWGPLYVGIDNGVSGSIGLVRGDSPASLLRMPTRSELNYQKAGKNITRLDFPAFLSILSGLKDRYGDNIRIVLEKPFVNPGNFVATSTSLRCLEAQLIAIEQLGLSRQYIESKPWQKMLLPGIVGRKELKKASADIGARLFPHLEKEIKAVKDADGLLIAEYARREKL